MSIHSQPTGDNMLPFENSTVTGLCADGWVIYSAACDDVEGVEEHILNAWETEGVVEVKVIIEKP